jgi:FG-GAP-like repeat
VNIALTMKGYIPARSLLISCVLGAALIAPAFANHRTGDDPLPELIVAGDFNQDGKLDLAVNVAGFDNIAIFNGDGQGGFTLQRHIQTDTLPKGLAAADINSDGHLDLVSINEWGYNIRLNLGDGLGGFIGVNELNGDGDPTRISVGDLNSDGKLDLIANAPSEGNMLIYFGDGNGGFSNPATELEGLTNDYTFAVRDLNEDGNLDLAVITFISKNADTKVQILLGDGAGNFVEKGQFVVNPKAGDLIVGDLNQDGHVDIVVGGAGPQNDTGLFVSTYLGDGTGNFTEKQVTPLGPGTLEGEMALADFNEDGNLDVAFPVTFSQTGTPSTTLFIFPGDGAGGLGAAQTITVGAGPHTALTADFNQDGHTDIAVSNRTDATISILIGDGTGSFTTRETLPVAVLPAP